MSNRLTLISAEYGPHTGPEGLATWRLANALADQNVQLDVITTDENSEPSDRFEVTHFSGGWSRPTRLATILGQLTVGAPSPRWRWVQKIGQLNYKNSIIYARSNPLCSIAAASLLALRSSSKLWLHFSDPIPSPWESPTSLIYRYRLKFVANSIERAEILTATTQEAIDYMADLYGSHIERKFHIVRNIVPFSAEIIDLLPTQYVKPHIAYMGGFGGERRPYALLNGIICANAKSIECRYSLHLIGTSTNWVNNIIDYVKSRIKITFESRRQDIELVYKQATITVVVDANDNKPVFLASKTAEAVAAARTVLIISPKGSPARRLFFDKWRSIEFCLPDDEEHIAHAIDKLFNLPVSIIEDEMESRWQAIKDYTASAVASHVNELILQSSDR